MGDSDSFAIDFDDDDPRGPGFVRRDSPLLSPPVIVTYLAGPLTNIDEDVKRECQLVRRIVTELIDGYDFLGVRFEVYDPAEVTAPGTEHSPEDVYAIDFNSTVNAELIVFHVNVPSLGVGMEAQISAAATIPRVIISKRDAPVSRMFEGTFAPTIAQIEYDSAYDVRQLLDEQISSIAAAAIESAEKRRPSAQNLAALDVGRRIYKQRILKNMTIQQLAHQTDTREYWLVRLERDPEAFATCSFIQFWRIMEALDCCGAFSMDVRFPDGRDDNLTNDQRKSLDNLARFVDSHRATVDDVKVFRIWNEYLDQQWEQEQEAGKFRSSREESVVSTDGWQQRYNNAKLF